MSKTEGKVRLRKKNEGKHEENKHIKEYWQKQKQKWWESVAKAFLWAEVKHGSQQAARQSNNMCLKAVRASATGNKLLQ